MPWAMVAPTTRAIAPSKLIPARERRNDGDPGERDDAAERASQSEALAQEQAGDGQTDQRRGGNHQARGAGGDGAFGLVEQQLVDGHPEEAGGGDQREVPEPGEAWPRPTGQHQQRGTGHGQPRQRQPHRAEDGGRHPDRGEGARPENHDDDASG